MPLETYDQALARLEQDLQKAQQQAILFRGTIAELKIQMEEQMAVLDTKLQGALDLCQQINGAIICTKDRKEAEEKAAKETEAAIAKAAKEAEEKEKQVDQPTDAKDEPDS